MYFKLILQNFPQSCKDINDNNDLNKIRAIIIIISFQN